VKLDGELVCAVSCSFSVWWYESLIHCSCGDLRGFFGGGECYGRQFYYWGED